MQIVWHSQDESVPFFQGLVVGSIFMMVVIVNLFVTFQDGIQDSLGKKNLAIWIEYTRDLFQKSDT